MESGLTRTDRWVQGLAFVSGIAGVLLLLGFFLILWKGGYRLSPQFDPAKTGQIGDFIGGVAGSLFALAAGLLFYLTLTLQRREFKNSLDELKLSRAALDASATHQENTLRVMREEKEFSVCMTAINDLQRDWDRLDSTLPTGHWVGIMRNQWPGVYRRFFEEPSVIANYTTNSTKRELPLPYFIYFDDCAKRAEWIANAILSKPLAEDDRRYLAQTFRPVLHRLNDAIIPSIVGVSQNIDRLLNDMSARLLKANVDPAILMEHKNVHVDAMKERLDRTVSILYRVLGV